MKRFAQQLMVNICCSRGLHLSVISTKTSTMQSKGKQKKIDRKQKRCKFIVTADSGVLCYDEPTPNIAVCNAGLSSGLQQEVLLDELTKHGNIENIVMPNGKSYCFVKCSDVVQAGRIFEAVHGKVSLAQNNGVLYLSYCGEVSNSENPWAQALPPGLIILPNFVTVEEEEQLLQCIVWANETATALNTTLKHRQVKHFGYEFLYGTNNVDVNRPMSQKIPSECDFLWNRLATNDQLNIHLKTPEQLTVNKYEPGQGIPPHVDTHSAFHDPIISLSLLSDIVMEFRQPDDQSGAHKKHVSVFLPRRSLVIMSKESRYGWTHGITPRKIDVYQGNDGRLTTFKRDTRISFTFRSLQQTACQCEFKNLCDTHLKSKLPESQNNSKQEALQSPMELELENVHKVYDEIANHFSETRHSPWPQVEEFVNSFEPGNVLIDIGCGNGKYLSSNPQILKIGCDRSSGLLNVCCERKFNVFQCDCLAVPIKSNSIDGCISIAVIHHLASRERRMNAITEMARILVKSGRALIYVWAKNQELKKKSSYLRQNKLNNKPQAEQSVPIVNTNRSLIDENAVGNGLLIHTNRTQFVHQDILVPWKLKKAGTEQPTSSPSVDATFLRFYHVFEEGELEKLCEEITDIRILKSYYDQGNWCVIFEKIS